MSNKRCMTKHVSLRVDLEKTLTRKLWLVALEMCAHAQECVFMESKHLLPLTFHLVAPLQRHMPDKSRSFLSVIL